MGSELGYRMARSIVASFFVTADCLKCVMSYGKAVLACTVSVEDPLIILECVRAAIGAGSDCWPCICQMLRLMGISCSG